MASSRLIFQIIVFMVCLNFSAGLLGVLLPTMFGGGLNNGGIYVNTDLTNQLDVLNGKNVTPSSALSGGNGFFSSILDAVTGGYFSNFIDFIKTAIWGFPMMLENVFGKEPFMTADVASYVFTGLKSVMVLLVALGVLWMWTGRNATKESL